MLSMNSSTSLPSWSRKYSAWARPVRATRARAPGGSVLWPETRAHLEPSVAAVFLLGAAVARARRLVHLAVAQGALGAFGGAVVLLRVHVDVGLDHLVVEVVAFAGAL